MALGVEYYIIEIILRDMLMEDRLDWDIGDYTHRDRGYSRSIQRGFLKKMVPK